MTTTEQRLVKNNRIMIIDTAVNCKNYDWIKRKENSLIVIIFGI